MDWIVYFYHVSLKVSIWFENGKIKVEEFFQSRVGAIYKSFGGKNQTSSGSVEHLEDEDHKDLENEDLPNEEANHCINENDNENRNDGSEDEGQIVESGHLSIYDPSNSDKINQNFRDLLIRNSFN